MTNLLEETIEELKRNEKGSKDVEWVGCIKTGDYKRNREFNGTKSWEDFIEWADFEYYEGFGGVEVSMSLVIVGKNWWLERYEYDGSECWVFKMLPSKIDYERKAKQ